MIRLSSSVKNIIGKSATCYKSFTKEEVIAFAEITGDKNSLHLENNVVHFLSFWKILNLKNFWK